MGCTLCPRRCGAAREQNRQGICHTADTLLVARAAPHFFEEPPISGTRGSGTVFFAGCSLSCIFCQNREISRTAKGRHVTEDELAELILSLADRGVHNINLVTGTHFTDRIARVLRTVKPHLGIPVVWNSSGYESPEALSLLQGLVDIYLPDFKYADAALGARYSGVPDYPEVAAAALAEMHRQTGRVEFDGDGMLKRGTVVRHLVLPAHRADSMAVLRRIADTVPVKDILLSLMCQYTPDFADADAPKNLLRRLTSFEYDSVAGEAERLGFEGFSQDKSAARAAYTPDFSALF
ncbi:MAG: radical SAM protein [Ruminococcaceae bacterium]|nr:radical SAM protein [Oscillospiraceae bacterium]